MKLKYLIIFTIILLNFVSCIVIYNKESLMPLSEIGNSNSLRKDGYYYVQSYVKTNPYIKNEKGHYIKDTSTIYEQIRINVLALYENGSAMKLGSYSGMQDNRMFNFGIKCNLEDSNTLENAFEFFECYVNELKDKNLNFINYKAEIWDQGVYNATDKQITVQIFYNLRGNYFLYEESGFIENDTTFIMTKAKDFKNGEELKINKTYRFRKMDDFPFIKNYILENKKKFDKN
jgi:hypothetical protein